MIDLNKLRESKGHMLAIVNTQTGEYEPVSKEVQQVRHGKWIDHDDDGYVECPFCGSCTNSDGNIKELHYCFNCGARMDEE